MITVIGIQTDPRLDSEAIGVMNYVQVVLKIPVTDARKKDLYVFDRRLQPYTADFVGRELLADKVSQTYYFQDLEKNPMSQVAFDRGHTGNWIVRFAYKTNPLMRDDFGLNAMQAIEDLASVLESLDEATRRRLFGIDVLPDLNVGEIRRVQEYMFSGNLSFEDIQKINLRRLSDTKVHDSIYIPVV